MKILLLGATGRTGKHVLSQCLEKGYEVSSLVRDPSKVEPLQGLTIFKGDVTNKNDLISAMDGCTHIISVLNISRKSDFPWSKLRTPPTLLSDTMNLLTNINPANEINKVVVCSAWGVAESKKDIPFWFRWLIDSSNIGIAYADHQRQEEILLESRLNYTIVRPVGLVNSSFQKVKESFGNQPKPSMLISRKSVAKYMINCLTNEQLDYKTVTISKS